jgi:outer membrane protein OmpA-like peptidoglycan-associated protein
MRNAIAAGLFALATMTSCANVGKKTEDMVAYEEARDSTEAEVIRERSPELFSSAQQHYESALDAHQDKEPELAEHHVVMANILWRTAVARSETIDDTNLARDASARETQARKHLAEARKRESIARGAVDRLDRIVVLLGKEGTSKARDEVASAALLIKEAEVINAREYASTELERADVALEAATTALESGKLDAAIKEAKVAQMEAKAAKEAARPDYEKNKARLAHEAQRRELFRAASDVEFASARMTEGGVTLTMHKLFSSGEVMIDTTRHGTLDGATGLAKDYPDFNLVVEGHTDSRGRKTSNIALSQARADAVVAYFSTKGIDPGRMTSTGKASASPLGNNKTRAGRAENRRIEIMFVQPDR